MGKRIIKVVPIVLLLSIVLAFSLGSASAANRIERLSVVALIVCAPPVMMLGALCLLALRQIAGGERAYRRSVGANGLTALSVLLVAAVAWAAWHAPSLFVVQGADWAYVEQRMPDAWPFAIASAAALVCLSIAYVPLRWAFRRSRSRK
ncbi:hypothetical protein [Cohnella nanjingensis]|uniref:Uncharacterized protein n=1 Tax=Cohnella nanjingensis TaxID=1387779 RepID=A0A7X0VFK8_9BACL|nr:hypothetical protein [Cohnella nanjingensis]MBB6671393.1 hypothetical protein [Cohnella nanjingensis]